MIWILEISISWIINTINSEHCSGVLLMARWNFRLQKRSKVYEASYPERMWTSQALQGSHCWICSHEPSPWNANIEWLVTARTLKLAFWATTPAATPQEFRIQNGQSQRRTDTRNVKSQKVDDIYGRDLFVLSWYYTIARHWTRCACERRCACHTASSEGNLRLHPKWTWIQCKKM